MTTEQLIAGGATTVAPRRVIHQFTFFGLSELSMVMVAPRVVLVAEDPDGQGRAPTVWIEHLVDAAVDHPRTTQVDFKFVPSGIDTFPADWHHVGSCVCGLYVWHVYQRSHLILDPCSAGTVVTP